MGAVIPRLQSELGGCWFWATTPLKTGLARPFGCVV